MPFTIDSTTLLIKGRKGDSASFTFNFNQDISTYTVSFYIKNNPMAATALIEKNYANPITNSVTVDLTPAETDTLTSKANSYGTYYWGLKISNGVDFAQTVIPSGFVDPPKMYIYPEIGD